MKVAIIGKGHVGSSIAKGLTGKGHEVKFGHRDPKEPVLDAAKWGEVIFIVVPYNSISDTIKELDKAANGKVVVDVTNEIDSDGELAVGLTTSGAEEMQKKLPKAFVVKAFNTVFAANQGSGRVGNETLSLFVASDSDKAKETIMQLGRDIGFEPVDAGPLKNARYLEPMAMLIIDMAYVLGKGTNIGYKVVKG